jgi:hypothetical protein
MGGVHLVASNVVPGQRSTASIKGTSEALAASPHPWATLMVAGKAAAALRPGTEVRAGPPRRWTVLVPLVLAAVARRQKPEAITTT